MFHVLAHISSRFLALSRALKWEKHDLHVLISFHSDSAHMSWEKSIKYSIRSHRQCQMKDFSMAFNNAKAIADEEWVTRSASKSLLSIFILVVEKETPLAVLFWWCLC